jgi:tRNA (guanine-N7-)-methyltransferase
MKLHLDEHPLFFRIADEDLKDDPCFAAIHKGTQEGQKVTRNHGDKWPAVYRRVAYDASRTGKKRTNLLE